jgi:cobalt transporter subunit CbtA
MFRTIVFSAFGAGLAVCLAVSALQTVTTEPLILHAEEFEGGPPPAHEHGTVVPALPGAEMTATHGDLTPVSEVPATPAVAEHQHDAEGWAPADGFERIAFTMLANLVMGVAVSLMLLGAMTLKGDPIDARRGLLWGIAAFAAVSLFPSLGLPPELPGTPAADIISRQTWWLGTAAASAVGLALLVFSRNWGLLAVGIVLVIAPHIIGAPEPPSHDVDYPGALAGEFVIASMAVSALLWSLSGLSAGWLHERFSRAT